MSMHRIEVNPLESGDVGTGVTLNMDNISGARLIDHSELQALMKKLNATVSNEERLQYLQEEKGPFLFSSAALLQIVSITPSVKTRLAIIAMLAPRLTDPKAKYDEFVGMFRYSEEKAKCEESLKARAQVLTASVFNNNPRGLGLSRASLGGLAAMGSRGGAKRLSTIPENGAVVMRRAVSDSSAVASTSSKDNDEDTTKSKSTSTAEASTPEVSTPAPLVRSETDSSIVRATAGVSPPRNKLLNFAPRERVKMADKSKNSSLNKKPIAGASATAAPSQSTDAAAAATTTNGGTSVNGNNGTVVVKTKPVPAFLKKEVGSQQVRSEKPIINENGEVVFVSASEAPRHSSTAANANTYLNGLKNKSAFNSNRGLGSLPSARKKPFPDILMALKSAWELEASSGAADTDNNGTTTMGAEEAVIARRNRILSALDLLDQGHLDLLVEGSHAAWERKAELFKTVVADGDDDLKEELESALSVLGLSLADTVEIASHPERWEGNLESDTETGSNCSLDIHAAASPSNCSTPTRVKQLARRSVSSGNVLAAGERGALDANGANQLYCLTEPPSVSSSSKGENVKPEHRYARSVGAAPISINPNAPATGDLKLNFQRSPSMGALGWGGWGAYLKVANASSSSANAPSAALAEYQQREREASMYVQLPEEGPVGADEQGKPLYSYKELVRKNICKSYGGIKQTELEQHMTESDFVANFGMSKVDFNAQPSWRRIQQKKQLLLF